MSTDDLHNIFQVGLKYIEKTTKGGAYKAITEGITGKTMSGMLSFLAEAVTNNTPYSFSVHSLRDDITNLKGFWEAAEACTECGGAIIMAVAGDKSHWTCVKRVTKNRLWCCDSDGLQWLNRKQCTMREMHNRRINELKAPDRTSGAELNNAILPWLERRIFRIVVFFNSWNSSLFTLQRICRSKHCRPL